MSNFRLDRFNTKIINWIFFVSVLAFSLVVNRANAETDSQKSGISVVVRNSEHNFSEYNDGDLVINRERGSIQHVGFEWHWQFKNGAYIALETEQGRGDLLWQGYDQSFEYEEHIAEYLITHSAIHIGHNFRNYSSYIGFGHRYRERNIVGGNLYEELDWDYASLGTDWHFQISERWRIKILWELAVALQSKLRAEFANNYDAINIQPGRLASGTGGLELVFNPSPLFSISIAPAYDFTIVAKGDTYSLFRNGQEVGISHQPKATYETISWQFNVSKLF